MKKVTDVKNLVFDFGGVIYQIDHEKQIKSFYSLGLNNFELFFSQSLQKPLFADFEKGQISEDDFRHELNRILGMNLPVEKIDEAWNSILVDYFHESVKLIENLKNRYRLFLMSNTNSIHYRLYINQFSEKYEYGFNSLFEKTFWSFQIGRRKPDADVFKFVMEQGKMNPEESIFIDDSIQNTIASVDAGMPSLWLKPGKKMVELFDEQLNLIID